MNSCQNVLWIFAALAAAIPYDYPWAPASAYNDIPVSIESSEPRTTDFITVTVTVTNTVSVQALSTLTIASKFESTASTDEYMTIAITNTYGKCLSLSFASDVGAPSPVGNPSPTMLPDNAFTQYIFPTGWAGRITVGPNTNPYGSKIEASCTGPPDVDVSYVDGYSVPVTCSSEGTAVSGCNIELFGQPGITCDTQVEGPVCLNPAQNIPNGPAPRFFAACVGAAYTYPNDNKANVGDLGDKLVSCCIGTSCNAPVRQLISRRSSEARHLPRPRIRPVID